MTAALPSGLRGGIYPCDEEVWVLPEDCLIVWTIYNRPFDYPDVPFVIRPYLVVPGGDVEAMPETLYGANTLDAARGWLETKGADCCLGRNENDDPHIVESWI